MKLALRCSVLVGLVATALAGCRADSHKRPPAVGGGASMAEAGAGAVDDGDAGADVGSAGGSVAPEGGGGDTSTRGGAGGVGTNGGNAGTPNSGGTPGAGNGSAAGSGGGPAAGATSGGASSAGTASTAGSGNGPGPPIEPPPHCGSVSQSGDADACSYEYTCEGRTHFDSCSRDKAGGWACECGTFSTATRYFELEGVEAPEACGVIARVCEGDVPLSPTRTCVTKEEAVDADTCSAHATCGYALDLGRGLVAREVEHYRARCKLAENSVFIADAFDCSCEGGALDRERHLATGPSIDDVCEPMLEYCNAEQTPVFSERVCGFSEPSGSVEQNCPTGADCRGCIMPQECGKSVQIARNVALLSFDNPLYHYVICRSPQADGDCACAETTDGWYGDQTISQDMLDVCRESRAVCPP